MRRLGLHVAARAVLLLFLLSSATAAQEDTTADRIASKSLQHLKEGRGHAREGRYPHALGDLRLAVAFAEQAPGADFTLALALQNLAEVYRLNGEPANALEAYRRALNIYEKLGHKPAVAIARRQIGALLGGADRGVANTAQTQNSAPASERRLDQINQAVDRIRQRLRPDVPSPTAGPVSSAPGSIELARSESSVLEPSQATYAAAVKQRIQSGWRYPSTATNKHQEGTVEVAFSVLRNGEIESIDIVNSSGFLPLDMESIRSIREAAPFGPVALPRGQQQLNLRMRFNYALPVPEANKRFKAQASGPSDR